MLMTGALADRQALQGAVEGWLGDHALTLVVHNSGAALPGSYWGDAEAGVCGATLHVRPDTPLHSLLHEACHVVCARAAGRTDFVHDAGGGDDEEAAVCLLQLLVADRLPSVGWRRIAMDMDAWGYRFVAGSTAAWFRRDSDAARHWLETHRVATPVTP